MANLHYRAHARHGVTFAGELALGDAERIGVRVVDLGIGGAGVEIDRAVALGERVTLHVAAPSLWEPLVVAAEARWCQPRDAAAFRAGLRFALRSNRTLRSLLELLAEDAYD